MVVWVGDPYCWQGALSFEKCCGSSLLKYEGLSPDGNSDCWHEHPELRYDRCCLANLSTSEAWSRTIQTRFSHRLDLFFAQYLPDYDCMEALPYDMASSSQKHSRNWPCACSLDNSWFPSWAHRPGTHFWTDVLFSLKATRLLSSEEEFEDQADCCILHHMHVVYDNLEFSVQVCPLGLAALFAYRLLETLTQPRLAYKLERLDSSMQILLQRFHFTTLLHTRWPIFTLLDSVKILRNPIENKYLVGSGFVPPLTNADFVEIESPKPWRMEKLSNLAEDVLQAVEHVRHHQAKGSPEVKARPLVLVSYVYGLEYTSVIPWYGRRLKQLNVDNFVLLCGDEHSWYTCRAHWWHANLCVPVHASKTSQALKYSVPAFLVEAGFDVFSLQFDAIILQDVRPFLAKHHSTHDFALVSQAYCYLIRATSAGRKFMRLLWQYLFKHGRYALEMWASATLAQPESRNHVKLPFVPVEKLPQMKVGDLNPFLFAQNFPGWDCAHRQRSEVQLMHLHSPACRNDSATGNSCPKRDLHPGTQFKNMTKLLSTVDKVRHSAVDFFCDKEIESTCGHWHVFCRSR